MKTIDMSTKVSASAYLSNPPEKTHTKEELDQLHACIRYTQMFKQAESTAKMDEEELLERPMPGTTRDLEKLKKLGIGRFK
jgi:phosphoglycolate phosphatase-like HAD superfamily hydrolase